MGAGATATIGGGGAAVEFKSDSFFWTSNAIAATYSYQTQLQADAAPPSPVPVVSTAPATKFAAGPTGVLWPFNPSSLTGVLGSVAAALQSGSSRVAVGLYDTYEVTASVIANTAVAPAGQASATCTVVDPWTIQVPQFAGLRSFILFTVVPDFLISPTTGALVGTSAAGFALGGSFGRIELSLGGVGNNPRCDVSLAPDWAVYRNLRFPGSSRRFPTPKKPLDPKALRKLFLGQHSPKSPAWYWKAKPPALTFIKRVQPGVSSEDLRVEIEVSDSSEMRGESTKVRRRRRS
jgi:hypothetical protein